jgi:hypothetical protein
MPGVPQKPRPYRPFSGYIPDGVISKNDLRRGFPYAEVSFDPIDADIDLRWAGGSREDPKFNNYYDYFFSGEDVKVYIDGLFDAQYELDISNLTFSIKQEKQPLFGFWSYNFDTIMYGVRIVAGSMSMYTRHPRKMTDLLVEAAKIRSESVGRKINNSNPSVISVLNSQNESAEDEINIQKYWARSQLDRITFDPANKGIYSESNNKHIFSHHPPFNLVIIYGIQENGLVSRSSAQSPNTANPSLDNYDRILSTDYNTRLTKITGTRNPMKIILQNVQLTDMSTGFDTSGSPLQEGYSFIARDMYFTQADGSVNPLQNIIKDPNTSGDGGSNQATPNTQYAPPGSTSTNTGERGGNPFYAS